MSDSTHIVLVFGSRGDASSTSSLNEEASQLRDSLTGATSVTVISFGRKADLHGAARLVLDASTTGRTDKLLARLGGVALRTKLDRTPLGRLMNSLGPLDEGRVFWRAVRRDRRAIDALRSADVVIAGDAAGIKTAWLSLRKRWAAQSRYDHRAAAIRS